MIGHRTLTIDCETLPARNVEETATYRNLSGINSVPNAPTMCDEPTPATLHAKTGDEQRSSLNGDTGRLLCIGFIDEAGWRKSVKGVLGWNSERGCFNDDEGEILRDFWELMRSFRPCVERIVGHNIYNFDLRFIYKRSVVCGVRPSIELNFARYRNQPIYDTMCEWEKWNMRDCISLDRLARVLSLESPKTSECDGSRIAEVFERGEHQTIRDYCVKDVLTTRRIYRRMTFADAPPAKPMQAFEHLDDSRGTVSAPDLH